MAPIASFILVNRTCFGFYMALLALSVKRVGFFGQLNAFKIFRIMTLKAGFRSRRAVFGIDMAVPAGANG